MSILVSMSRRLVLYPNGNKNNNGTGHISLYLEIAATDAFSLGWEVNVNIRFIVFDQIRDKYLTIQGILIRPKLSFYCENISLNCAYV
jgi:hypothetical protein